MNQFQTTVTILNLMFVAASEDRVARVSIQKPLGKGLSEEVGGWEPYIGLHCSNYVPPVDFKQLSHECAKVYVAGLTQEAAT